MLFYFNNIKLSEKVVAVKMHNRVDHLIQYLHYGGLEATGDDK